MVKQSRYDRLYPTRKKDRDELKKLSTPNIRRAVWLDPAGNDGAGSYTIDGKTLTRAEYIALYGPLGTIDVISTKHTKGVIL